MDAESSPSSSRSLRKMQSFEIELCSKAQSREIDFTTWPLWDNDSTVSPHPRWSLLRRFHSEPSATERLREVQQQFDSDLAEARLDDSQDLEMLDFIRLGSCDRKGHKTLLFIAKHIPIDVFRLERTQRFVMQKFESVGQQKCYSILYLHSGSNLWNNHLGLRTMWNLFSRIPQDYRDRLEKIYILHPDMYLQVAMCLFVRWFMHALWEKVHYLNRLEDLHTQFPTLVSQLPSFVKEHDVELEAHPLMDYGFCTLSEVDAAAPTTTSGPAFYT